MKTLSILIATSLLLSVSAKSACADGGIGGISGMQIPQIPSAANAPSTQNASTSIGGMSPQQQNEMNLLMNSINTPIQNPRNPGLEMQFKQQQQVQLQNMINQMKSQKSMQDQMQTADPDTAKSLEQTIRRNEILRLTEQMNKPVFPSSPMDIAQQTALKQLQKAQIESLRNAVPRLDRTQVRQGRSASSAAEASGMTALQQSEMNELMRSINSPIQNPYNQGVEMQYKAQQQVQLQNLINQVKAQKSIQEQIQKADPNTAKALEEGMRQNEMKRLTEQLNRPIFPANPMEAAQQASLKTQQKAELDRLQSQGSQSRGAQNETSPSTKAQEMQAPAYTQQQLNEMNQLRSSIGMPIQNPLNAAQEMQFKAQQQIQLQELTNKMNEQKSIQQQIQNADPATATALKQGLIQNEVARLKQQISKPIMPSNPTDVAQQAALKSQQQAELERLMQGVSSGTMHDMMLQNNTSKMNQSMEQVKNVLEKSQEAQNNIQKNMR